MLLCNSWKAFYREMQHQSWTPAPQNHQHHTWTRDQASLLLSTPFLREMNSRNSSFSSPSITSFQKKKLLHLSRSPSGCRICSTAPGSRAEHHLALLHPSHPAGSGCIHLCLWHNEELLCVLALRRGWKRDLKGTGCSMFFHSIPGCQGGQGDD